ncbi:hypothetical protein QFZ89_007983 [Paraburkholderia youngii]
MFASRRSHPSGTHFAPAGVVIHRTSVIKRGNYEHAGDIRLLKIASPLAPRNSVTFPIPFDEIGIMRPKFGKESPLVSIDVIRYQSAFQIAKFGAGNATLTVWPVSLLNLTRQFSDLRTLLFVGRRHMHRKQLPQCVHRHVHFAAFLAFVPVIACTRSALACRLQRPAIKDHCTGLTSAILRHPDNRMQVMDHSLETARLNPALRLLVDRLPRRKVIGQQNATAHPRGQSSAKR